MPPIRILTLPGDGIGPEVVAGARAVVDRSAQLFGLQVEWSEAPAGGCAIDAFGTPLPDDTLESALRADAVLLGAVGGPKWDKTSGNCRPEQALLGLRKGLELFANLRPVAVLRELIDASPIKRELIDGVDILFVRELTGGIYFGKPSECRMGVDGREAVDTLTYTESEVARVVRLAFQLAQARRARVTSVDKANILATSRLWREVTHEIAREFPKVSCEDLLVDAMAMHLVKRPRDFDVIVTENMFGDILTDEASLLAGSLGMLPSASLGDRLNSLGHRVGLYEPIHGSAPDIAGRDLANPLGTILSAALMLRYSAGLESAAAAIESAVGRVLASGLRTADIAGSGSRAIGCKAMAAAVCEELRANTDR